MQYSAMLPPAKTKDAVVVAPANGRYAVYDGNGYMTNPSDPANEAVGDTVGGMLRFLAFGATDLLPVANADTNSVLDGGGVAGGNVLDNDDPGNPPSTVATADTGALGTLVLNPDGSYTYTSNANGLTADAQDVFNYTLTDADGDTSSSTLTITVIADLLPVAAADSATATAGTADISGNLLANDTLGDEPTAVTAADQGGTAITLGSAFTTAAGNSLTLNADGSFTFSPVNAAVETFNYTITDTDGDVSSSTLTVTVEADLLPAAAADTATATAGGADVTGNVMDNDVLGNTPTTVTSAVHSGTVISPITIGVPFTTPSGNTLTLNADGSYSFTPVAVPPAPGLEIFGYGITDADGDVSSTGALIITVTPAAVAPVALHFSTIGAGSIPGVAGPFDDADIYTVDTDGVFAREYDAVTDLGLPNNANVDGLSIDGNTIYVSFADASTTVPGVGAVQDEDVVAYDTVAGTWSLFFDGTAQGLTNNGHDLDAISVVGGVLYFSTVGNANVGGLGAADDGDIYSWNGATFARVFDASAAGLATNPANAADIDALTVVDADTFYISFIANVGTTVPTLGVVQDESVVLYDAGNWSMYFSGAGQLDANNIQDVDAMQVP
jgi:VCBS repeat-containing protein